MPIRKSQAAGPPCLVRYRVIGGSADVDQRLTVFANGLVELDERHRSRAGTQLEISAHDLEQLREALGRIPEGGWSGGRTLVLNRAKAAFVGNQHFEIRMGRRSISGETDSAPEADGARAILDNLRVHAVRLAESLKPTGGPSDGSGRGFSGLVRAAREAVEIGAILAVGAFLLLSQDDDPPAPDPTLNVICRRLPDQPRTCTQFEKPAGAQDVEDIEAGEPCGEGKQWTETGKSDGGREEFVCTG